MITPIRPRPSAELGEQFGGQALVEFALVIPLLLLLMVGVINTGILVNAQVILTQAAWEGARAGATLVDPVRGDQMIVGAVQRACPGLNTDDLVIAIAPAEDEYPRDQPWPLPRGYPLQVEVDYPLKLHMPWEVTIWLEAKAVSRMEYSNP
jgi:hypothetical protein